MRVTIKDAYGQVEPARKSRLWLHFVMKIQTLLLLLTFITSAALAKGVEEQDSASPDQFSIDTQDNAELTYWGHSKEMNDPGRFRCRFVRKCGPHQYICKHYVCGRRCQTRWWKKHCHNIHCCCKCRFVRKCTTVCVQDKSAGKVF